MSADTMQCSLGVLARFPPFHDALVAARPAALATPSPSLKRAFHLSISGEYQSTPYLESLAVLACPRLLRSHSLAPRSRHGPCLGTLHVDANSKCITLHYSGYQAPEYHNIQTSIGTGLRSVHKLLSNESTSMQLESRHFRARAFSAKSASRWQLQLAPQVDRNMPRQSVAATNAASAESQQEVVTAAEGIENYELPKTLVTRIAKSAIPENAKVQKEAMHALLKASTLSRARGHKSVGASDVIKAIETIEFNTDGLLKFLEDDLEGGWRLKSKAAAKAKSDPPRKLKIVVAPIQDEEAEEEEEGEEIDELEDDVDSPGA
ncbi:Histone-like transcription factor and archaeal histone protein [Ceratobasidium theobromae]|uniref:DNA polymerase epsilon subunit D n=1 Tax=Ceratobasidium theobromae TaxID=1582974 RepID=A0A5N5QGZ8_9AGAM|nr:Histone-like transcription factor and archaeal histone protein [Ceratobasidium theobromae]